MDGPQHCQLGAESVTMVSGRVCPTLTLSLPMPPGVQDGSSPCQGGEGTVGEARVPGRVAGS